VIEGPDNDRGVVDWQKIGNFDTDGAGPLPNGVLRWMMLIVARYQTVFCGG
jgi:hypothetical protein